MVPAVDVTSRPAPHAEAPTSSANNRITTCAWNVMVRTECEIQHDTQESPTCELTYLCRNLGDHLRSRAFERSLDISRSQAVGVIV